MLSLAAQLAALNDVHAGSLPQVPAGMTGEDRALYTDWLSAPHAVPRLAFFNVRVGPDPEHLAAGGSDRAALQAQLLAPRIDMLFFDGAVWWVVEFHVNVQLAQLGRLLGYPLLLARTYDVTERVRSVAVARVCNPFLVPVFTHFKVPVFVYAGPGQRSAVCDPAAL